MNALDQIRHGLKNHKFEPVATRRVVVVTPADAAGGYHQQFPVLAGESLPDWYRPAIDDIGEVVETLIRETDEHGTVLSEYWSRG